MVKSQSWFLTKSGQRFSVGVAYLASVGAFSAHWLPHGYCLDRYKKFVQMYREGREMPLEPEVQERAQQALKDCNLPERELKPGVQFFCVHGVDLFYAGTSYLNWGMTIGIPRHFAYKTPDDVEKQQIRVFCESVSWESKAGKKLVDSLILSEYAQKFAIARQIHRANTLHPIANGGFGALGVILAYSMGRYLNTRLNLYERSRMFRLTGYSLTASIGLLIFWLLKDTTSLYWDRRADDKAIEIGLDYLKGGIEFYEKVLKRNKALRELMGDKGKSMFTVQGNESVFIRTKALPLTERLDYLKEKLSEMESES